MARQHVLAGYPFPVYVNETATKQEILAVVYLNETVTAAASSSATTFKFVYRRHTRIRARRAA